MKAVGFFCAVLVGWLVIGEVQARVSRDIHSEYLAAATAAGGCKDKEFLAKLEKQYTKCQASDEQFKELYKAYDGAKAASCNRQLLGTVQETWNLNSAFSRELRAGGGDPSGCS